jgi:ribosomal-protein-alanine N-acetyltransferase
MQKSPNLRTMHAVDLKRVYEIERASFKAPWSSGMIKGLCALENSTCLVLDMYGSIQGYVFARTEVDEVRVLHIVNLAVEPSSRRQGYGWMILTKILERGRNEGCDWAYLEVRPSNLAAIRLYEKAGFAILRKRSHYYEDGSDAYVMGAEISKTLKSIKEER